MNVFCRLGLRSAYFWRKPLVENGKFIHLSAGSPVRYEPSKVKLSKGSEVKWCSCGLTKKEPFCDGSNSCNGKPLSFKAAETKEYNFCNCKNSKNKPFCDGSHAQ